MKSKVDRNLLYRPVSLISTWDAWRLRFLSYALGSYEFLMNAGINVRDALKASPDSETAPVTFADKVCIITGANAGIGLATAKELVARGAHVIMACRSPERGQAALQEVLGTSPKSGCHKGSAELLELDLSSLKSVKEFASLFNRRGLLLDLLICNAGIMAPLECLFTRDGLEEQFQVNYLGHWLLAHNVLIQQRKLRDLTPPAHKLKENGGNGEGTRVLFLSSLAHLAGLLNIGQHGEICASQSYSGYGAYANSKLAAILASKEFQSRFDRMRKYGGVEDVAVSVHPGLIDTHLAQNWIREGDVLGRYLMPLVNLVMRPLFPWVFLPVDYAVRTVLYAASAPADKVKGAYIADERVTQPSKLASDPLLALNLWKASCKLCGITSSPTLEPDELVHQH
eukprot:jgi/Botrbrau1/15391/Bobra.43_2s0019.1